LEKKVACLLLTSFSPPTAFLRQNGLYHLIRTWWTPYVIRWNIRKAATLSPGTCIFWSKYTRFFSIYMNRIFLHFSWRKIRYERPHFSPFSWRKILPKSNIFLHVSGAISWLSGWIYAFDLR
jgi:hypothetical protein